MKWSQFLKMGFAFSGSIALVVVGTAAWIIIKVPKTKSLRAIAPQSTLALWTESGPNQKRTLCKATVLDESHVLTSAHCIHSKGVHGIELEFNHNGKKAIRSGLSWSTHPDFKTQADAMGVGSNFDIAVVSFADGLPEGFVPLQNQESLAQREWIHNAKIATAYSPRAMRKTAKD